MSDSPDELILKMQHLEAQAKEQLRARGLTANADRLKSSAQKIAWAAQLEVAKLEAQELEGEALLAKAKAPGASPLDAGDWLRDGRQKLDEAKKGLIRARAKLNFALDQLTDLERREYEAFHAGVRADFHGQMAEDPLFNKGG